MRHIPKTVPHGYVGALTTLFGDSGDRMRRVRPRTVLAVREVPR
jgi:hypothetical protein